MSRGRAAFWLFFALSLTVFLTCLGHQPGNAKTSSGDGGSGKTYPAGHLKPIGSHRKPEGEVEVVHEFPEPQEFYKKYVEPGKPVLFKGMAKRMPTFQDWTDDKMRENFGDVQIEAEIGKKEKRNKGMTSMPMKQFLDTYKKQDIYMVQSVNGPMKDAFYIPKSILCGGFEKLLQDAVLWFSSGGTKSVLHNDGIDNINCIFDGTKNIVFFDKNLGSSVEQEGWVEDGSYSRVDVEKVDMLKFPGLQNLPWWNATLEKGDCLFIPMYWYHHVSSLGDRNLAVNIWFINLLRFDPSSCKGKDLPDFMPFSKYEVVDTNEQIRSMILQPFKDKETVSFTEFKKAVDIPEVNLDEERLRKVFALIDLDKDMELSWDEMSTFNVADLLRLFPELANYKEMLGIEPEEDTEEDTQNDSSPDDKPNTENHDEL